MVSITKAYSTASTDALHVISGCPPLDLKIRTEVMYSQQIQCIKNSREIGGLDIPVFEMARNPWEVMKIGICRGYSVNLDKGSRGFEGNECADQLAKMASTKDLVDLAFCISRIQIKNAARRKIPVKWQEHWSSGSKAG
ncbi:hypothetical protein AVEN_1292-1 [Araneus ventricosus]|uniref:RNase H type-1 domain-containing protein n=1 Tax=Araneus ventricosus TaxID=182803 RepID=A0A4Y2HUZ5_ARAVE|nr:hypothetical protein AVEN_1292-1 [Araneus ventricosus]